MILQVGEKTLNLLVSPYPRISRHLYVFPDLPVRVSVRVSVRRRNVAVLLDGLGLVKSMG